MKNRAIFLDRDGTLIEESGYLYKPEGCRIFPWTIPAIRMIHASGWKAILTTNQAGVAKGYFQERDVWSVHDHLQRELQAQGAPLDDVYYCPHHPNGTVSSFAFACGCRKPNIGMLQRAAREHEIDISSSWVVGDRHDIDMQLARNAGAHGAMVLTGYGQEAYDTERQDWPFEPEIIAADLLEAVRIILSGNS